MAERPHEPGFMLLLNGVFEVVVKDDGRKEEAQVWKCIGFSACGVPVPDEGTLDVNMVENNGYCRLYCAPAPRVVLGCRRLPGNAHTYNGSVSLFRRRRSIKGRHTGAIIVEVTNCVELLCRNTTDHSPILYGFAGAGTVLYCHCALRVSGGGSGSAITTV
jgi:hypothetical protein